VIDDTRTVREKLAAGYYDVSKAERMALSYEGGEALWDAKQARFKADTLREVGLAGHPKADRAFAIAEGWADSTTNVLWLLEDLAKLLMED
jgi:hypothetical protein